METIPHLHLSSSIRANMWREWIAESGGELDGTVFTGMSHSSPDSLEVLQPGQRTVLTGQSVVGPGPWLPVAGPWLPIWMRGQQKPLSQTLSLGSFPSPPRLSPSPFRCEKKKKKRKCLLSLYLSQLDAVKPGLAA